MKPVASQEYGRFLEESLKQAGSCRKKGSPSATNMCKMTKSFAETTQKHVKIVSGPPTKGFRTQARFPGAVFLETVCSLWVASPLPLAGPTNQTSQTSKTNQNQPKPTKTNQNQPNQPNLPTYPPTHLRFTSLLSSHSPPKTKCTPPAP